VKKQRQLKAEWRKGGVGFEWLDKRVHKTTKLEGLGKIISIGE
jgi:hypothetical protein